MHCQEQVSKQSSQLQGKKNHILNADVFFYEDASFHLSGSDKASRLFETASI